MTVDERIQAVVDFRFTERQARFLVLVMRHAGVCVPRQYASFAGIAQRRQEMQCFLRQARQAWVHGRQQLRPQPRAAVPPAFQAALLRHR